MKEKSKKKGSEHLIGKIIYATLLFAPLFSILATTLYTVINKNAKDSYYGETINEEIVTPSNSLQIGETYTFLNTNDINASTQSGPVANNFITYTNVKIIEQGNMSDETKKTILNSVKLGFFKVLNNNYYTLYFYNSLNQNTSTTSYTTFKISFTLTGYTFNTLTIFDLYNATPLTITTYNKYSYLDNAFDYGIYKVEQNNLYNWAKSTGTYTVVKATAQGLGITNDFTPLLLTYWLIISVMYFIYDIGLVLVVIVHRKIHDLEDSML